MAELGSTSIDSDKVKVAIRVRPFNRREIDLKTKCVVEVKGDQTVLHYVPPTSSSSASASATNGTAHQNSSTTATLTPTGKGGGAFTPGKDKDGGKEAANVQNGIYRPPKTFTFDHCFWSFSETDSHYASQEYVFQQLGTSVLDSAFQGYNACIFAYGQTGSGKSYTMMGSPHEKGLIPRLCDALFERIEAATRADTGASFKLEVSYMEIYNEKVHDLLDPAGGQRQSLKVREHNILGPYVDGLSTLAVSSFAEIDSLMAEGNKSRTVAATNMNSESSRSHAVFTLTLTCSVYDSMADVRGERVSKMSLVDLAGSERAVKTGAVGERLKEGSNINKSLTTLGLVISKLADQAAAAASGQRRRDTSKSSTFVPYRDSVLTWLLKDNLGGNSKTIMISTISPAADSYEETLSTLRYADRAKRIVNHAVINEDPNNRIIRELREEVEQLKEQLLHATVQTELQERLVESEKLIKEMEQTWEEKLRRTEKIHQERQLALEKMGISVQSSGIAVEKDRYYLVNLNADPSMNALLVYYLKERTLIGRPDADVEQDIQLSGVGIMPEHAVIEIDRHAGEIWMEPAAGSGGGARTYVNGRPIGESRVMLRNGDRILWGNNHFFSLNCPISSNHSTAMSRSMTAEDFSSLDYAYARDELMSCTNPGLDAAIYALERQFEDPYRGFHQQYQQQQNGGNLRMTSSVTSPADFLHHHHLSGSTHFLQGSSGKFGGSQLGISGGRLSGSSLNLASPSAMASTYARMEKLAQEREENMRASLSKLREEIAKANTLAHEANLISEEMRRNTEFKVTLQIPAANLSPNRLRRGVFVSEPAILVKRKGAPQQVWSMEKFDGKLIEMREMYAEWKERQNEGKRLRNQTSTESDVSSLSSSVTSSTSSNSFSNSPGSSPNIPRRHDPFYELQENHLLVGVANIFLEVLMQDVLLDYQVPIISQQGEVAGRLAVEFGRIEGHFGERIADAAEQASDSGSSDEGSALSGSTDGAGGNLVSSSEVTTISLPNSKTPPPPLRPNQIRVRLTVKHARGLPPELSNFVFCQYSIWGYPDLIAVPCTAVEAGDSGDHGNNDLSKSGVTLGSNTTGSSKSSANPDEKIFQFANSRDFTITLSEEFLEHCADGALSIEVWGHRISAFSPHSLATLKTEWGVQEEQSRLSRSLAERWRELKRRLILWVEIHELNDNGEYVPVEVQPAADICTGGVYQLRQGQQRRLAVRVAPQGPESGTLPLLVDSILWTAVGCVTVRPKGLLKSLDSYQEGDLNALTEKWSEALARRQAYLHEQITELMEKSNTGGKKTQEDIEREHRLTNQWVSLVEERNAAKCPPPGSEIPGAPAAEDVDETGNEEGDDRPPGMESHVPVIFLDLNSDDLHLSSAARISEVPGANSILPKEHNGSAFFNLPIVASTGGDAVEGASVVALWDSSIHESASLNRLTAPTERIFLIVKTAVRLSHPALIDVVLRKRIAINVYKKQSLTKSLFKRISRAELPLEGTGVAYEIVASIPKASEDIEDRESLALLAASGVDLTACDGESYIERYTKSVSAVENLLQLERLRQEVAVREQLTRRTKFANGRSTMMQSPSMATARTPMLNGGGTRGSVASEAFLRKTVSVPNIASQQQHQFGVHRPAAVNASSPLDATAGGHRTAGTPTTRTSAAVTAKPNGDSAAAFDLSYFSTAADRLRRGASSLFGSMTGGLNQLGGGEVVIEEADEGSSGNSPAVRMEKVDVHPLSSAISSPISINSPAATTPSSSKQQQQQHLKQPMCTLLEEQNSREDEDCNLVEDSQSKIRVQVTPPKANKEYVVFGNEDDEDDDEEVEGLVKGTSELRVDTPTLSIHSASSGYEGGSSSHSQTTAGGGISGGTPISTESAVSSVPSSLSMPSSTTGSGDEEEEEEEDDDQNELQQRTSKTNASQLPEWMAIGESVRISPDSKLGVIAYVGETDFAPGLWIGVVLDSPTGKNDGTVNGVTYFTCKPKFGIFVRPDKLKADPKGRALRQAAVKATPTTAINKVK